MQRRGVDVPLNAATDSGPNYDKLKVVIVEDEPLFCELLQMALSNTGRFEVVGTYDEAEQAIAPIVRARPDVAIVDISLKGDMNGVLLGVELRRRLTDVGIVLLSNHRLVSILDALPKDSLNGWGYLLKSTVQNVETLVRTVRMAAAGMLVLDPDIVAAQKPKEHEALANLTPRQYQTLQLMAQGYTNQGIAERLGVSVKSVENHTNQLYGELGIDRSDRRVQPRVQAVLKFLEQTRGI